MLTFALFWVAVLGLSSLVTPYQNSIWWRRTLGPLRRLRFFELRNSRDENGEDGDKVVEFGTHRRDPEWQKRSKRWVILVDDEEPIRKAVGQILFNSGYQVTVCADGLTALNVAQKGRGDGQVHELPDAIISDVRMPGGMDGLELLQEIRNADRLAHVPVVLLSAKGQTHDRIAGYEAGADAYIPKPFDPEELITVIDTLMERQEELSTSTVGFEDLARDLQDIKMLLLKQGGGGVGNGFVEATRIFLAPDERQVLELLCEGLRNKEIAERTFLSTRRVEQLLTSMFRKTKVKNRTELVRWAVSTGNVKL